MLGLQGKKDFPGLFNYPPLFRMIFDPYLPKSFTFGTFGQHPISEVIIENEIFNPVLGVIFHGGSVLKRL